MDPKPNKNEALEALDFIINVLKEHEKDLDRLIGQLGIITDNLGETGEISSKIENIEDRISILQNEIKNMVTNLYIPQKSPVSFRRPTNSINIMCRKWDDFKNLASGAETVSYNFKLAENIFLANALKNSKLVSYMGDFPPNTRLLKSWLSKELDVAEEDIVEGTLNTP
jgi:hypothetical protein